MKEIEGFNCKIFTDNVEDKAIEQIKTLLSIPVFSNCKIRVMPDVHAGAGCVIGFTADLGDKVIPNIVGVDIGCGMSVIELESKPNFKELQNIIDKSIPSGFYVHGEGPFTYGPNEFYDYFERSRELIEQLYCKDKLSDKERLVRSVGSLGGGNHFIEIDYSLKKRSYYLVIHTGSRNLGKQVCDIYQDEAVKFHTNYEYSVKKSELVEKLKSEGRYQDINSEVEKLRKEYQDKLPGLPKDLCWIEGVDRDEYLHDMAICQSFANLNREFIAEIILCNLKIYAVDGFTTIHNYLSREDNIIRKGAISCKQGERVIIPMNMRDGSLICYGKGNQDWNCSGPHGAGRIMSRMRAFKELSLDDYKESMNGIWSASVRQDTIDEAPMVYKPMQEIINNIKDTVIVDDIIKPVFNFKAAEQIRS